MYTKGTTAATPSARSVFIEEEEVSKIRSARRSYKKVNKKCVAKQKATSSKISRLSLKSTLESLKGGKVIKKIKTTRYYTSIEKSFAKKKAFSQINSKVVHFRSPVSSVSSK